MLFIEQERGRERERERGKKGDEMEISSLISRGERRKEKDKCKDGRCLWKSGRVGVGFLVT